MSNQSRNKSVDNNKKFNALVIPVMLILGLLPLIVHLKTYETNLTDNAFFLEETYYDIFLYYKSLIFIVICTVMLVLTIVRAVVKHESLRFAKLLIPLAGYAFLSLLSAICSQYGSFSFTGIYEQFESVWVLLGYAMTVYYCFMFISTSKDVDIIMIAFTIGTVIMLLIGLSQAFSKDIFRTELGRKIILPMKYWSNKDVKLTFAFPLGRVYMTLYNPNYVGSYVSLIAPVFLMLAFAKKKLWLMIVNIVIYIGLLLSILGSGSRAGFLGVGFSLFLLVLIFNKKLIRFLPEVLIVLVLIIGVVYTYNNYSNDQLLSKVRQALSMEESNYTLKSIETNDDCIAINYNDNMLYLSHQEIPETDEIGINVLDEYGNAVFVMKQLEQGGLIFNTTDERFENIIVTFGYMDNYPVFLVEIDGKTWQFVYSNEDKTYYYITNTGKFDKINNAPYVESLNNYSKAFSNRGFIWSRTIPLLKDNLILGTGPDTFILAFPNDDYVAMSNGGYSTEYITKPHNMYLQIAVQTGVLSLICFLVFYFWYFITSVRLYRKSDKSKYLPMVGIGILCGTFGYMVVGIINDSMVVIAPIFWAMIGIGLAINHMIKRDNIFPVLTEVTEQVKKNKKSDQAKKEDGEISKDEVVSGVNDNGSEEVIGQTEAEIGSCEEK
ncbi:MAG: O-antigen ligase family protein [Lachnospiraceae bacterium]|nr:O-antigen ligase family protein [Lachnospiraceae bacterium]